jgi:demethylsterigmatocystin 6-O-methyltransferase
LGVFRLLQESKKPLSVDKLAAGTGAASPALLIRVLRGLSAFGYLKQTGPDEFTSNRVSNLFTDPNMSVAINHL